MCQRDACEGVSYLIGTKHSQVLGRVWVNETCAIKNEGLGICSAFDF